MTKSLYVMFIKTMTMYGQSDHLSLNIKIQTCFINGVFGLNTSLRRSKMSAKDPDDFWPLLTLMEEKVKPLGKEHDALKRYDQFVSKY